MNKDAQRGERIKQERSRLGLSQQKAADAVGVRREMWAKYEAGAEPGAETLAGMRRAGVDVDYLLTGKTLEERAAEGAASMPARLRALREQHGLVAVVNAANVTAKEWLAFEECDGPPAMPRGSIQRLIDGFHLDATLFITGKTELLTTARTEETELLKNYRACSPPDQEAIRHHAQFLASRRASSGAAGLSPDEEARLPTAAQEHDAEIARALAKARDNGSGVTATPPKGKPAVAVKKGASRAKG